MRPESFEAGPDTKGLKALGIPDAWLPHVVEAGYSGPEHLKDLSAGALREKLNGYRKKNKLDVPALSLEDVEAWVNKLTHS